MLHAIPCSASGAAAAIVSRSFPSAIRCSGVHDRKYAGTLAGFSIATHDATAARRPAPDTRRVLDSRLRRAGGTRDGRRAVHDRDQAVHGAVVSALAVLRGDGPR